MLNRRASALVIVLIAAPAMNIYETSQPPATAADETACAVHEGVVASGSESDWLNDETVQAAADALGAVVEESFGAASKDDPVSQLRKGYIGTAIDDQSHQLVLVIDPKLTNVDSLSSALASAHATDAGFVRVQSGCNGANDLIAAGSVIADHARANGVFGSVFSVEVSPHTSTWDLEVPAADAARVRSVLRDSLPKPELVSVTAVDDEVGRQSGDTKRRVRASRHRGDVAIGRSLGFEIPSQA